MKIAHFSFLWPIWVLSALCFSSAYSQHTADPEITRVLGNRNAHYWEYSTDLIATADGRLIVTGQWQDTAFVMKFNSCGALLWQKKHLAGSQSQLSAICELPGGHLAATGYCEDCAPGDSTRKAWVLLMDENGNLIRDTVLGNLNLTSEGHDLAVMRQGSLAVTGIAFTPGGASRSDAIAAIFDPALNLITYQLIDEAFHDEGRAIIATQDSGLAIAGLVQDSLSDTTRGLVVHLDATANPLWVCIDTSSYTHYLSLAQKSGGDLVAAGGLRVAGNHDAYVAAIQGTTGTLLNAMTFGGTDQDEARAIVPVTGGFLVACMNGTSMGRQDWIFKLSPSFAFSQVAVYNDFPAHHDIRSIVALSPEGDEFAMVSNVDSGAHKDIYFVKRKKNGKEIAFTECPHDYQLYPRDRTLNTGHVQWTGLASDANVEYDSVRLCIYRNDTLTGTLIQPMSYTFGYEAVNFSTDIPAELANYTFVVQGKVGGVYYTEAEACEVVAGDAFIITGQSNAEAPLPYYDPLDTVPHAWRYHSQSFVRNFGLKYANDTVYTWHKEKDDDNPMADPRSGQWGLVFADSIVQRFHCPVAILNGGISGIAIESMFPLAGDHYNQSTYYGRFLKRALQSGLKDNFRSLCLFQGEANAILWNTPLQYTVKFEYLNDQWELDFPGRERNYVFQTRHCYNLGGTEQTACWVAESQREIADDHADYRVLSSTGLQHDAIGIHYDYFGGYEIAGLDIFRLIAADLYGEALPENSTAPNIDSIYFSNAAHTEITLAMRDGNDGLSWYPGIESDFYFELVAGNIDTLVTGGSIAGNHVVLTLSSAPPDTARLCYTSHAFGNQCPVKNARGMGMLCFYNLPIDTLTTMETPASESSFLRIYPNPLGGEFLTAAFSGETDWPLFISIYEESGKRLMQSSIGHAPTGGSLHIEMPDAPGVYLLEMINGKGERTVTKVVKM